VTSVYQQLFSDILGKSVSRVLAPIIKVFDSFAQQSGDLKRPYQKRTKNASKAGGKRRPETVHHYRKVEGEPDFNT
jgi:hypothetical protein